jgi:hypothetical protein
MVVELRAKILPVYVRTPGASVRAIIISSKNARNLIGANDHLTITD